MSTNHVTRLSSRNAHVGLWVHLHITPYHGFNERCGHMTLCLGGSKIVRLLIYFWFRFWNLRCSLFCRMELSKESAEQLQAFLRMLTAPKVRTGDTPATQEAEGLDQTVHYLCRRDALRWRLGDGVTEWPWHNSHLFWESDKLQNHAIGTLIRHLNKQVNVKMHR